MSPTRAVVATGGPGLVKDALVEAYESDGLTVHVDERVSNDNFVRLLVSDEDDHSSKVELGWDWRAQPPVVLDIGPVLHPDDAVANKVTALWGRTLPRDYLDVDAALTSGRYTRADLLRLTAEHDGGFDPRMFAAALAELTRIPDERFASYGIDGAELAALRALR